MKETEFHFIMGPTICMECGSKKEPLGVHSGLVLVNGYPSPCPNSGKEPFDYIGLGTTIKKSGPYLGALRKSNEH